MLFRRFISLFLLLFTIFSSAQEKFTLSGVISDEKTNETLIGVSIIIEELRTGTSTNEYGFYSITLPKGLYTVRISYLGYKEIKTTIDLNQNIKNNFLIIESEEVLNEIVLVDNPNKINIKSPEMSVNKLSINTIKQM
uniref:carboxypeptidase-like regulatory domain-containing protein n=1 Tax=uncultured Flavobacterium sp. TaxID=165435 RepID=UPI0030EF9F12